MRLLHAPIAIIAACTAVGAQSSPASADSETVIAARLVHSGSRVPEIKWKSDESNDARIDVRTEIVGEKIRYLAILEGRVGMPNSAILFREDVIELRPDNSFKFEVEIFAQATDLKILLVDAHGNIQTDEIGVFIPDWEGTKKETQSNPPRTTFFTTDMGFSSLTLRDSRVQTFSQTALTGRLGYHRLLFPPHWDMAASTYFTVLPITRSRDDTVRFLGANLRVGYVLPVVREPWKVSLQTGLYYASTFVSSNTFGYKNVAGPQFYPSFRRMFKKGSFIGGALKYSPITDRFSLLSLTNREFAAEVIYSHPWGTHLVGAALSASDLRLVLQGITVESTAYTFSLSFTL